MRARITLLLALGALLACAAGPAGAAAAAPYDTSYDTSYDAASGERFIPVELWTGAAWDGSREIRMAPADLRFGGGKKSISGPTPWIRPGSDETLPVYTRRNGDKVQLFTVTSRGDGLGRVFDSRYGRDCVDEVKFPLGMWRQGETRTFLVFCGEGKARREIALTIEKIDFTHRGVAHALQYHWVVDGGRGTATDMHYIYSPGRGMVEEWGNE